MSSVSTAVQLKYLEFEYHFYLWPFVCVSTWSHVYSWSRLNFQTNCQAARLREYQRRWVERRPISYLWKLRCKLLHPPLQRGGRRRTRWQSETPRRRWNCVIAIIDERQWTGHFCRSNCASNARSRSSTEEHASIHSNNVLSTWKALLLIHCVWVVAFLSVRSTQGKNFKFDRCNSSRSTKSHQLSLLRSTGSESATVLCVQVKHSNVSMRHLLYTQKDTERLLVSRVTINSVTLNLRLRPSRERRILSHQNTNGMKWCIVN